MNYHTTDIENQNKDYLCESCKCDSNNGSNRVIKKTTSQNVLMNDTSSLNDQMVYYEGHSQKLGRVFGNAVAAIGFGHIIVVFIIAMIIVCK